LARAVPLLEPEFDSHPAVYGDLMLALCESYQAACRTAKVEPDGKFLAIQMRACAVASQGDFGTDHHYRVDSASTSDSARLRESTRG
jgi:hypothetical protein